jgi:hypothetical protein
LKVLFSHSSGPNKWGRVRPHLASGYLLLASSCVCGLPDRLLLVRLFSHPVRCFKIDLAHSEFG